MILWPDISSALNLISQDPWIVFPQKTQKRETWKEEAMAGWQPRFFHRRNIFVVAIISGKMHRGVCAPICGKLNAGEAAILMPVGDKCFFLSRVLFSDFGGEELQRWGGENYKQHISRILDAQFLNHFLNIFAKK